MALFWVFSVGLLLLELLEGLLECCCDWLILWCQRLRAQEGNWKYLRAVLMWSSSLSMLAWVEDTVLALCAKVLKKGVGEGGEGLYFKLFHKDVCYEGTDGGTHNCT